MTVYYPYIPVEHLEVVPLLKANWRQIRDESDAMFKDTDVDPKPNWTLDPNRNRKALPGAENMYYGKNFSAHLRVEPELLVERERIICASPGAEDRRKFRQTINPTLMGILKPWLDRGEVGNIGFNRIWPGAKISPHYGVSTRFFRLHLGLHCDPGATFFIEGDNPYVWQEGQVMAFADGHWLHWVEHNGKQQRTILAIDFLKSILGPEVEKLIPNKPI